MVYNLIGALIDREGGYVDHRVDRGGPTNMGITQSTLAAWRGVPVTREDVRNLTQYEATQIYYSRYWKVPGLDKLGRGTLVQDALFDAVVHHGPSAAVMMLQRTARVVDDGVIGPVTLAQVETLPDQHLIAGLMAERLIYTGRLITRDHSQAVFAHGWLRRMAGFVKTIPLA